MKRNNFKPLPGYPWKKKFNSLEEIKEYMDNEKLTCLLCGREYNNLTMHIKRAHKIHPDEYKEKYDITYTTRLAGKSFRNKARKLFLKKVSEGKLSTNPPPELIKRIIKLKKRKTNTATRNSARMKTIQRHGRTKKIGKEEFEEYLKRIETGRTITEVGKDKDMPNAGMFYDYLQENKSFKKRFNAVWENLPFKVQARGQKLGERFSEEVIRLKREKLSWEQIGNKLNCNSGTAHARWIKLGRQGKLRKGEYTPAKEWQKRDYEEFLKRVKSGRTPKEVSCDPDMPSIPCVQKYRKRNPFYQKRYEKIYENLPFHVQQRAKHMGEKYKRKIVQLRLKGLTWPQIGEKTGIYHGTAQTTWSKLKTSGKLKDYM